MATQLKNQATAENLTRMRETLEAEMFAEGLKVEVGH